MQKDKCLFASSGPQKRFVFHPFFIENSLLSSLRASKKPNACVAKLSELQSHRWLIVLAITAPVCKQLLFGFGEVCASHQENEFQSLRVTAWFHLHQSPVAHHKNHLRWITARFQADFLGKTAAVSNDIASLARIYTRM